MEQINNPIDTYGRNNKKDYTGLVIIICVLALAGILFAGYLFNEKKTENNDLETVNDKILNNKIILLESSLSVLEGKISDLPTGSGGGGGVSTDTLNNMLLSYYKSIYVYNKSETYNQSELDGTFSLYLLVVDQRYNDTDLINSVNTTTNIMSLGFYNDSYIDDNFAEYYNISQINDNLSNYLLLVDQRYNDTALINSINTTLNIMALGFYNTTQVDDALSLKYNANNPSAYISSYIDTNASTECNNGEYLDGDGTCKNFNSSVSDAVSERVDVNKIYVDNIAEKTAGHNVVFDNDLFLDGATFLKLSPSAGLVGQGKVLIKPFLDGLERNYVFDYDGTNLYFAPLLASSSNTDLGNTGLGDIRKWKDLYLSGDANIGGDANIDGDALITGNATASYFKGDGSQLTGIDIPTDYWKTTTAQTSLTGDKTGSFDLTTTGTGRFDGGIGVGIDPSYAIDIAEGEIIHFRIPSIATGNNVLELNHPEEGFIFWLTDDGQFYTRSMLPAVNDESDVGSSSLKYRNLSLSRDANIGGDALITGNATASYFKGDGSELTNLPTPDLSSYWNSTELLNGTLVQNSSDATLDTLSITNIQSYALDVGDNTLNVNTLYNTVGIGTPATSLATLYVGKLTNRSSSTLGVLGGLTLTFTENNSADYVGFQGKVERNNFGAYGQHDGTGDYIGLNGDVKIYDWTNSHFGSLIGLKGKADGLVMGTLDNIIGIEAEAVSTFTNAINVIGLNIKDVNTGTNQWAIKTGDGLIDFGDDVSIASTHKLMLNNGSLNISHDGTNARLDYGTAGSNLLYLSGNVSAVDYFTRTPEFKSTITSLDTMKNPSTFTKNNKTEKEFHNTFDDAYTIMIPIKDKDNCSNISDHLEYCYEMTYQKETNTNCFREPMNQSNIEMLKKNGFKIIQTTKNIYKEVCENKLEKQLSIGTAWLDSRNLIYELKQENEILQQELCNDHQLWKLCELALGKDKCTWIEPYPWCSGVINEI